MAAISEDSALPKILHISARECRAAEVMMLRRWPPHARDSDGSHEPSPKRLLGSAIDASTSTCTFQDVSLAYCDFGLISFSRFARICATYGRLHASAFSRRLPCCRAAQSTLRRVAALHTAAFDYTVLREILPPGFLTLALSSENDISSQFHACRELGV